MAWLADTCRCASARGADRVGSTWQSVTLKTQRLNGLAVEAFIVVTLSQRQEGSSVPS
jgi:hypothetical protein